MEIRELKKLKKAVELRDIDKMISLAKKISPECSGDAEKILSEFYRHEVSVANAVIELVAYSKVYKHKIKPPLKGCFCFVISNPREDSSPQ
ncbi:ECU11_1935 [Encephalitozoon cuniculi GB-M1]|uniref:ECU11_1935 protein n=1 Tax=Encephalitozoon cuniculi (strain GB-M1) TaxID=284813 RepID=I7IV52_ENCCU|nr:uncharacterized protein ECU11_1935 [Encephalitozoon cuniculi GB-M1]CCI74001.1 ECU11_1935 [Encephalitozoon cuniculi GB-M1]